MSIGKKRKVRALSLGRRSKYPSAAVFLLLLLSTYMLPSGCAKEKPETSKELVWLKSFDEALKIASQKEKMIMIDFYADWCGWCKKLDETTYKDSNVIAKAKDLINVRIDADEQRDLASRYRISGLPTILFVDSAGREIHRVVGYRPPQDFVKEMILAEDRFSRK